MTPPLSSLAPPRFFGLCLVLIFSAGALAAESKPKAKPPAERVVKAAIDRPARAATAKPAAKTPAEPTDPIVAFINEQIREGWKKLPEKEVAPSPVAEDEEWIRRVYLDMLGHIPPWNEVEKFAHDKNRAKRSQLVDQLLEDAGFVRNWTTIWTNLAIGRQAPQRVSRKGMESFFREAFSRNRPWNEVVYDLISAEGHFEQKGAVNYLLAQLTNNDEGVQATAKTARLFMGVQLQCTQCHDHPINNWKQAQFWQINSFLRQARRIDHRKLDPKTNRRVDDYTELVDRDVEGPVFFEKRNGEMQVAYPIFFETTEEFRGEDRRKELARLMTTGEQPLIARAMVNRVWAHFFGYGFTNPVDDMGPHKPPSHPELLDRLASEFVASKYDVRKLVRWIANSESYSLTSRFGKSNAVDDPSAGRVALFSRMYPKALEAEQLYDSLIIATEGPSAGRPDWSEPPKERVEWVKQFVIGLETDENDEATTFNGTIAQALVLMNGPLVEQALRTDQNGFLRTVLAGTGNHSRKIRRLYLATLSRQPTSRELALANRLVSTDEQNMTGYQDLFWALLNSNEFIINH